MKIFLRTTLKSSPDAAWKAIADPRVFASVSSPLLKFSSQEPGGFPEAWQGDGPHAVKIALFGFIPLGTQTIDVAFTQRPGGVRMMVDSGRPLKGMLALIASWDHRMAISSAPNNQTLYRDRLLFKAGVWTPFIFMTLWMFWQWRGMKLRRLAKKWS